MIRSRVPAVATRRRDALVTALVVASTAAIGAPVIPPGEYAVTAQVLMPHLDGMRRQHTSATVCLGDGAPDALFSVLRQYALRGCTLGHEARRGYGADYVLVCASARVAGGTARVAASAADVTGTLAVRMGGKNMTFTQQVTATRLRDCTAPFSRGQTP